MLSFIRKFHQKDIELMESIGSTPFDAGFWKRVRILESILPSTGMSFNHLTIARKR